MEPDVLGEPYRRRTIPLADDAEGPVVATLVDRSDAPAEAPAVLYLHGFSDYFFHPHVADFFASRGFAFYALDLRKAGRSLLPHQTPHFVRHLPEYFAELDAAAGIIRRDGHSTITLYAHSTGALTASLWAHRMRGRPWVSGLILNSPFFAFKVPSASSPLWAAPLDLAGLLAPRGVMPRRRESSVNVESLHHTLRGEWDFDLSWKPLSGTPARFGWMRAVDRAQRLLRRGLRIPAPVLVAAAADSYRGSGWDPLVHNADAVLDVEDMARWAPSLGPDVTVVRVAGGRHDLALSQPGPRNRFFAEVDEWMRAHDLIPVK